MNSKRSRIPRVMDLVRHLTLLPLRHSFYPRAKHIEGKRNDTADSLSRFQMDPFFQAGSPCRPSPVSCAPSTLGDLNADIQNYLSLSVAASTKKKHIAHVKGDFSIFAPFIAHTSQRPSQLMKRLLSSMWHI